jgi:hypothetical protein
MGVRIPAAVITSVFRSAADITADYSDVRSGPIANVCYLRAIFYCTGVHCKSAPTISGPS